MPLWLQIMLAVCPPVLAFSWWLSARISRQDTMLEQIIILLNKNESDVQKLDEALEAHREDDRRDIGEVKIGLTRLESRYSP
jgi:hypothetical protein